MANLWVNDGARPRPLPIGAKAHWLLTDGDITVPEAIIGARAMEARRRGIILAPELAPPDWQRLFNSLLEDPETEVP